MLIYSKGERGVMTAAFTKLFKANPMLLDTKEIKDWMENAPVAIVEYEGSLPHEKSKMRDRRMELYDVYDGNISTLVNYLRQLYPNHKALSKWELIFTVCSGISDVQKVIEQAELQVAFGSEETTADVPQETEEQMSSHSSSTEEASVDSMPTTAVQTESRPIETETTQPAVAETPVSVGQELVENAEVTRAESTPKVETVVHTATEENSASQEEVSSETVSEEVGKPSGNVHDQTVSPLFDKPLLRENKEDKEMGNGVDELLQAANAATVADPAKEQEAPGTSNVSATGVDEKEAQQRVAELLGSQKEQRNAWTRQNVVTGIVSTQKPSALRVMDEMGLATDETDPAKADEAVTAKINKFIAAVSGVDGITIADFENLPDDKKYANVVEKEGNKEKAAAIYNLYKQIKQNPTGKFAAFIPAADKVSYPTKGYVIGSQAYPVDEFIVQLIDNGNGVIYGEGSCDAQGNDAVEKPVTFQIGVAKRTEKTASKGIVGGKKETKIPVVRPKNRKEFISDASHIVYLFTKEDQENMGKASFKAAINVGGVLMPATVSVYALENGAKKQRGTDKDGNATYKTKVASCAVSVPVTKIVKEFEARFKGDEDITVTAGRWGVNMTVKAQKGNYGQIGEFSQSPIFDVFADVYAGNVTISAGLKGSSAIATLRAAANEQAAADAQASADELA